MAKSANQKLKLLYIVKILKEQTDEEHPISTKDLIEALASYDVQAERKSIYDDINQLIDFGYDIIQSKAKVNGGYYLASRTFELAELKLLVDAVSTFRFISLNKSRDLIKKLESLVSKHEAGMLNRQVYVTNRVKTENENLYYRVDELHRAIRMGCNVSFKYLEWNVKKELVPRRNGKQYLVSPFALTCKDENYYMIAYDIEADTMKHYRVDKMGQIKILEGQSRSGIELFEKMDLAAYTNSTFGMFGGEEETVTLVMDEHFAGVVLDRFGKDVALRKIEEGKIQVRLKVAVSSQFFGWVTGLGKGVKIISPESVAKKYLEHLAEISDQYLEE